LLGGLGLVLVGVALLLCASLPSSDYPAPWAMIVVPLVPLVGAVVCVAIARSKPIENGFDTVKKQLNADMAMLREVSTP
jgi:peptidoglycan/LPS O-acetylase OafA/YrhL